MKKKEQEKKTSFVRLTRLDGSPIWLNASFIVTIEPRKGGGTTVVPIGDGLDYDVREAPEAVLSFVDGAPVPEVVPVPTSDALTPTPDDVSPNEENDGDVKKPDTPAFVPVPAPSPAGGLLEGEIARLRKMAPRTVKKLQNTIMTQFKTANSESAIASLVSRGIIVIDGTRVNWQQPETEVKMVVSAPAAEPPPQEPPTPEPSPEEPPREEKKEEKKKPAAKKRKSTKKK